MLLLVAVVEGVLLLLLLMMGMAELSSSDRVNFIGHAFVGH